ncbi:MAG: glycosyltransferase family 4 protein [Rhodothermales bacterium]|nr:glycosyltransferase family 4 protein [Rhodothermales bacterium]
MKILYYSPHPDLSLHSPSGYGTHMREMIKAFEEAGHEVRPLIVGDLKVAEAEAAPRLRDRVKPLVPALVWESARDAALLHRDRRLQITLEDNIQAFGPNLIYERASFMQCSGVEVAWRLGVRHVLEVNAPYLEERKAFSSGPSLFERKARAMERRQLSMTDRAVVVSSTLKDHFMAAHGLPEERFLVVPNAVDPDKIVVHPDRVHAIKTGYGLTDQFVVGFVGSLFRWHGVDRLIRAAAELRRRSDGLVVLIVGDGEIRAELEALAQSLGVSDIVRFTGNVAHEEVFDHIEAMDACVMPDSNWYGSPVKLFEYGAMRKPIVAPDNGPVRDVFTPFEDGLVVRNEAELAEMLRRLMADPEEGARFAGSFHRKVIERHTWRRNAEAVLETLAEAVV